MMEDEDVLKRPRPGAPDIPSLDDDLSIQNMSKNNETKIINKYFELESKIWRLVGCEEAQYPGLEDGRDYHFFLSDREVLFGTPGSNEYWSGDIYGTAIFRGDKFTIVVYDNGCGDRKCSILFANEMAVDREAFEA